MKKSIQYIDDSFLSPKDAWDRLSLKEKSDMIRSGVENGITKLQDIRKAYNEFAEGGDKLSRKPTSGSIDEEFMASNPNPMDILARSILNYSNQEFGHHFPIVQEQKSTEPAPLNLEELKRRQRFMETGFKDNLTSPVGAKGRYQITDNTLAEYTKKTGKTGDLFDPTFNEAVRDWYMNESLENRSWITKGEPTDSVKYGKKLAAYNYGPTNVVRALEKAKVAGIDIYNTFDWLRFMPKETQDYVNFILRNKDVNKHKNQAEYDKAVSKLNKKELGGPLIQEANKFRNVTR